MSKKLFIGDVATYYFLEQLIHPNKVINNNYDKIENDECLGGLFFIKNGVKAIKSKYTNKIFRHDSSPS